MKVLVLGGAGFIGRHLSKRIADIGGQVTIVDNLDTSSPEGLEDYTFVNADLKTMDEQHLEDLCRDADIVYHLAGSVGVELGDKEPKRTLYNNVELMLKIMPVFERAGTHVVFASTSEVYGNGPTFQEDDPAGIGPSKYTRWGYSTTKLLSEFMLRVSGIPYNIIRFFNIVGPGQLPDYGMVLPRFIKAAKEGQPLLVHGDGSQVRSFCHIQDAVEMLLQVRHHPGELFNIGNQDNVVTMKELAERVIALADNGATLQMIPYDQVFSERFEDIMYRVPDTTKIRNTTGYVPKYSLDDIIVSML